MLIRDGRLFNAIADVAGVAGQKGDGSLLLIEPDGYFAQTTPDPFSPKKTPVPFCATRRGQVFSLASTEDTG